ncbi:MAG: rhomboid family intramembrane serine protease [Phycisphaerae bacterium]|nr:rhomboid family intramembrane serine protease [Phycisphaerae bacterium]MDD5381732.1 rhomboid family intramembrane serine protease [Phycisphaerae bacterium]
MGLYDRDYTQANFHSQFNNAPQMRMTFPRLTPAVKWLLIINIAVFLAAIIIKPLGALIYKWFQLDPTSLLRALQVWRLVTYQFLHDPGSISHIVFNMLGLYFLGPTLERHWSSKRFLIFYFGCGIAGGLFYILLVIIGFLPALPMVGASGAILGMLAACAILFPHFVVFIFLFPVPIRVAAIGLTAVYLIAVITRGINAGGDAAHLAGMAAGAIYVFSQSWRTKLKLKFQSSRLQERIAAERNLQAELDRILQKVHDFGIHSLTQKEKKILEQATEAEQKRSKL